MEKKERKKITWKDFGPEKIILIAIAGIILLVTNFSEWKAGSGTEKTDTTEKTEDFNENESYIERTARYPDFFPATPNPARKLHCPDNMHYYCQTVYCQIHPRRET